jgi:hypothetical protein
MAHMSLDKAIFWSVLSGLITCKIWAVKSNSRAGGVIHVVECLPSKCEASSSNPSTAKKKKKITNLNDFFQSPSFQVIWLMLYGKNYLLFYLQFTTHFNLVALHNLHVFISFCNKTYSLTYYKTL